MLVPPALPLDYNYTPCYCEENIYLLAESFHHDNAITGVWEISVVFISNDTKSVVLWNQKQSREPEQVVIWDYHCILVLKPRLGTTEPAWVFDYDSRLAMPCCWSDYVQATFGFALRESISEQYRCKFRIVPASDFLENFASDRSHMMKPSVPGGDPEYVERPPQYPCIVGRKALLKGVSNNLMQTFVEMSGNPRDSSDTDCIGTVMNDMEFWKWGGQRQWRAGP